MAQRKGIQIACSNEAFGLWYLLHFHFYDAAMSRAQYQEKLSAALGVKYIKNSPDMYRLLRDRPQDAMAHTRRLLARYSPPQPEQDNPSTTVHLLVEELLRQD